MVGGDVSSASLRQAFPAGVRQVLIAFHVYVFTLHILRAVHFEPNLRLFAPSVRESYFSLLFIVLCSQAGYDHSYFFISSFVEDHINMHADRLLK